MKLKLILLLIIASGCLHSNPTFLGEWKIVEHTTEGIHALTQEEASRRYGKSILITEGKIQFGDETLLKPTIIKIAEGDGVSTIRYGNKEGLQIKVIEYEVHDSDGERWMSPLGNFMVIDDTKMTFQWDGLTFIATIASKSTTSRSEQRR